MLGTQTTQIVTASKLNCTCQKICCCALERWVVWTSNKNVSCHSDTPHTDIRDETVVYVFSCGQRMRGSRTERQLWVLQLLWAAPAVWPRVLHAALRQLLLQPLPDLHAILHSGREYLAPSHCTLVPLHMLLSFPRNTCCPPLAS